MTWQTVQMKAERLNGLKLRATRENRSVANLLDTLLLQAGINELSDKELDRLLKELAKEVATT